MKINILASLLCLSMAAQAQLLDFENIQIPADSFINGSEGTTTFNYPSALFPVVWNSAGYWQAGWAASNRIDTTLEGYEHLFNARPGKGANETANYLIGQQKSTIYTNKVRLTSFQVSNTNYAYYSMLKGDQFAKKFGGATGNDPDFFKLKVENWNGGLVTDTLEFFLADFRSSNNQEDYIISQWVRVEAADWSIADSIVFRLSSSDNGQFGMNTPSFFAIDEIVLAPALSANQPLVQIQVYPNPARNQLHIPATLNFNNWTITDLSGKQVLQGSETKIDVSTLERGFYLITTNEGHFSKWIKE